MDQLDALINQADAVDAEQASTTPEAQAQAQEVEQQAGQTEATAGQVRMILDLAGPLLGALYPSLPGVLNEQAKAAAALSLAPVLVKYNIDLSKWGAEYREEIGALMVCGPLAWACVQAVKADIRARAEKVPEQVQHSAPQQVGPDLKVSRQGMPEKPMPVHLG